MISLGLLKKLARKRRSASQMPQPFSAVYVAGSGRSGSTLLDLLLHQHSAVTGLGEVHRVSLDTAKRECGCGRLIPDCSFWKEVVAKYAQLVDCSPASVLQRYPVSPNMVKKPGRRLPTATEVCLLSGNWVLSGISSSFCADVQTELQVALNSWCFYDAVSATTGADVVVDSTKDAVRLKALFLTRPSSLRIVNLIRDGRAVAASHARRTKESVSAGARIWKNAQRNVELMLATVPRDQVLQMKYEDLCTHPTEEMNRVFRFLGLKPGETSTRFRSSEWHQIPGNPMLFNLANKDIRLDEKWRTQLKNADLKAFGRVAGRMNRRLGYD